VTTWEHHVPLAFHSGREADHSPPSSAEVKEWVELYLHSPTTSSWRGAELGGAQGQLYLYLFTSVTMLMLRLTSRCVKLLLVSSRYWQLNILK
jgi:hypothetical protein